MKLKFPILFSALVALSVTACKQKETAAVETTSKGVTIPDSVLVDVTTAREYVKNYASHAGYVDQTEEEIRARVPKKPDTRCVWFSKDRLKQMLNQLEKEDGDGVRFYMITYNNKYDTTTTDKKRPAPPKKYWGYNTLLMVSTRPVDTKEGILHFDYYKDIVKQESSASKTVNKDNPGFIVTFVPENRGELCPPPSNCVSIGATLLLDTLPKIVSLPK
ncbi:hypothetical protein HDF26_000731 [Pedobacter cryoconitis]|uniref:Lipoprotein n=1 Tax=Pedobacter cryoconitis TaxID=188932 RepID=A0A7W8ZPR4_9SPHI|nr:hypothetical protein [Pedobacter cryoconitis]MBB5637938.1 hypothetical protein [Pedobacter cryoconitis]MBB6270304.1 hypothetical protein [Pedobacter cryoconitis]